MSDILRNWKVQLENRLDGATKVEETRQDSYGTMIWYLIHVKGYDLELEWEITRIESHIQ